MEQQCCVCGEPLDEMNVSRCRGCGGYFHQAWSTKSEVPQCGKYWIDEDSYALVFACARCLRAVPVPQHQPDDHGGLE